jgi:hypothetical protein
MHEVLHYNGGATVRVSLLLLHREAMDMPLDMCRALILALYDTFCGSKNGSNSTSEDIDLRGYGDSDQESIK